MAQYIGLDIPFLNPAGTQFFGNTVVVPTMAADGIHVVPGYAAPGILAPIGVVVDNNDPTNGTTMPVGIRVGGIIDCIAGAAINPAVEPLLTWDSQGRVIPVGAVASTIYPVIGTALEGCSAVGDKISVLVNPQTYTTHA